MACSSTSPSARTTSFAGGCRAVRRHLHDIIEEYGRHTGHMDLLREAIDGCVGEDPPADCPMLPRERGEP